MSHLIPILCFMVRNCAIVHIAYSAGLMVFGFYLQFGYIVLTTSAGIMDHEEARRKNVGGKVLGFFY